MPKTKWVNPEGSAPRPQPQAVEEAVGTVVTATKTIETKNLSMVEHLSREMLEKVAEKLRLPFAPNTSDEVLRNRIGQQQSYRISDAIILVASERDRTKPVFEHSQDEILEAVAPYIEKGMKVEFDDVSNTFQFSFGRKVECGTVFQPIRRIELVAASVCTPSRGAATMGRAPEDNTYTGNILAV